MQRNRTRSVLPDPECVAHGVKFCSQIDRGRGGHSGALLDENGSIRWRYGTRNNPFSLRRENPFNKPDFVISGPDAIDEAIIRRASFIPSVFNIMQTGAVIGRVEMRSIFRNKYAIDVDSVSSWTFRMPLFTVRFFGDSRAGAQMWVVVGRSKMEWNILIKGGVREWPLLAALAFIHTEWWNYG